MNHLTPSPRVLPALFVALILLSFSVYSQKPSPDLELEVRPMFGNVPLVLGNSVYSNSDTLSIDRFRFYISSVVLTFENGQKYIESNSWHLIDAEVPSSLLFSLKNVPEKPIAEIAFNIGIDSVCSVSGALSGDLDPVKGMYWAWNSGYINAKLEGKLLSMNGKKKEPFEFHIG
jgi:hypothetical protein